MPRQLGHDFANDKQLQVRTEEYLNLARAARAHASYAAMLVKLGRTPDAIEYALKSYKRPDEALAFAKVLREVAAHDDALKVADAGLGLAADNGTRTEGS